MNYFTFAAKISRHQVPRRHRAPDVGAPRRRRGSSARIRREGQVDPDTVAMADSIYRAKSQGLFGFPRVAGGSNTNPYWLRSTHIVMAVLVTRLSGLGFDTTEKCRCRRSHPHTSSCPGRPKAETRASTPPSRRVKPWMAVTSPRVQSAWHHAMDWEPGGKHGHDECTECFHGTFTTHFTQPDIGATSAGMTNHGL